MNSSQFKVQVLQHCKRRLDYCCHLNRGLKTGLFLLLLMHGASLITVAQICQTVTATDTAYIYTYGGAQDDYARQIISTSDSGFIVVGSTSGYGSGTSDIYLVKMDSKCNKQWSKV